jgi:hypothetical protein
MFLTTVVACPGATTASWVEVFDSVEVFGSAEENSPGMAENKLQLVNIMAMMRTSDVTIIFLFI